MPALGSKPLAGLTAADIRSWHADQSGDMPTARAHAYALLRTILGSAVDDGLIPGPRLIRVDLEEIEAKIIHPVPTVNGRS